MGKKKLDVMEKEKEIFINGQVDSNGNVIVPGCIRNGIDAKSAEKIFAEMAEFAKYAFNKSHAACYAVVAYRTAYLKAYYQEELMAATLNSFLGNLDRIPVYIEECKNLDIEILKPSINKSDTKFTVEDKKIRFGLGSVKNVGFAVIDDLVKERKENGEFKNFTDFCERMNNYSINKKCIESLIKAGAFDEFGKTRATLLASFETIIDSINNSNRNKMENQVSMFDLFSGDDDEKEVQKYTFIEKEELDTKEYLSFEKEMLGIYLSGHPLEKYRQKIEKNTNINSLKMLEIDNEVMETGESKSYQDGQTIKIIGIISKVKKKITKKNTLMAFVNLDDLYGSFETIVFETTYNKYAGCLEEEKIVLIEGRLSIREDEPTKIIVMTVKEMLNEDSNEKAFNNIDINITFLDENKKEELRKAIRVYSKVNVASTTINVIVNDEIRPCGKILLNNEIINELEKIVGKENMKIN